MCWFDPKRACARALPVFVAMLLPAITVAAARADYDDAANDAPGAMADAPSIGDVPGDLSVNGQAGGRDDRDFFSFNVQQSGRYAVTVEPASRIVWLYLFDEHGALLDRTRNAPSAVNAIDRSLEPGRYFVKVQRIGDYATDYALTIGESAEPTDAQANQAAAAMSDASADAPSDEATDKSVQGDPPSLIEGTQVAEQGPQTTRINRRQRAIERREARRVRRQIQRLRGRAGDGAAVPAQFKVFDRINFEGKPDLIAELGMDRLQFVGESDLWLKGEDRADPNLERCREVAARLNPQYPVCINIEHWYTNVGEEEVEESIDKLIAVADAFKEANPELKIGFYRMLPVRNYFTPVKHSPDHWSWRDWERQNTQLDRLAEHVDIIFPSLYTIKPDYHADGSPNSAEYANYATYVRENIKQARRYGMPVYAFVAPYYIPCSHYWSEDQINGVFFQFTLETVTRNADGLVIWTSHGGRDRGWDPQRPWWIATQQYVTRREISKLASFD